MKLITVVCLGMVFLFGNTGKNLAADIEKGFTAFSKRDYAAALQEWKPLAEQGIAYAQVLVGVMHEKGFGVPQDYELAVKWWRLAAKQGEKRAWYNLGYMYDKGYGVEEDPAEAVKWWRLAAEKGFANAQNNLGNAYAKGRGVIQDIVYAHMWFNLANAQGAHLLARDARDDIAREMTTDEVNTAEQLAVECMAKEFKGCMTAY